MVKIYNSVKGNITNILLYIFAFTIYSGQVFFLVELLLLLFFKLSCEGLSRGSSAVGKCYKCKQLMVAHTRIIRSKKQIMVN